MQGKLVFYDLKADGEKIQVMADVATSGMDLNAFVALHNSVKIGDIVGASGYPGNHKICQRASVKSAAFSGCKK